MDTWPTLTTKWFLYFVTTGYTTMNALLKQTRTLLELSAAVVTRVQRVGWEAGWSSLFAVMVGWLLVIGCLPGCKRAAPELGASVGQPESVPGEPLQLFDVRPIGDAFTDPPQISYVELVDFDGDGLLDVLVCDCRRNTVSWIRQLPNGSFQEAVIANDVPAPASLECVDFDQDGDLDLLVAALGVLFPSDDRVGSLFAFENLGEAKSDSDSEDGDSESSPAAKLGEGQFQRHTLLDQVARVADVRAADLDGDQDLDLTVTQFGYNEGGTRWLENQGQWQFKSHGLLDVAGGIHGPIADFNGDTHPDIAFLISQELEKTYVFWGNGSGQFRQQEIFDAGNPDFGSAGISVVDLDQDGDPDILYCNGDAFDYSPPRPWPWHGVQWLENLSNEQFRHRRLLDFGGAVNARAADYDADGDLDIFVTSTFNDWSTPESQSLMVLENTGSMRFTSHALGNAPTHIQAIDVGDVNGDGRLDLVTGGMHVSEPYDRVERIVLWQAKASTPPKSSHP